MGDRPSTQGCRRKKRKGGRRGATKWDMNNSNIGLSVTIGPLLYGENLMSGATGVETQTPAYATVVLSLLCANEKQD